MSKKNIIILFSVIIFVMAAVFTTIIISFSGRNVDLSPSSNITIEEAKNISLSDSGLSVSDVIFEKAKLDNEDGVLLYEIEFSTENADYEYEIIAETGKIYSKDKRIIIRQTDSETLSPADKDPIETDSPPMTEITSDDRPPIRTDDVQSSAPLTMEEARSIALSDAGLSQSGVTFIKSEQDYDKGITVYEIEFCTSVNKYEYEINALNGTILKKEIEGLNDDSDDPKQNIGLESAKAIALSDAGLTEDSVTFIKIKQDYDNGILIYELEFCSQRCDYEYEISASDGKILKRETEMYGQNSHHSSHHHHNCYFRGYENCINCI